MSGRHPVIALGMALCGLGQIYYALQIATMAIRGAPSPLLFKAGSADFPLYTSTTEGLVVATALAIWGALVAWLAVTFVFPKPGGTRW